MDQYELALHVSPVPLGIPNTEFPFLIEARIEKIRAASEFYN
jgi:hypothetical protein